MSVLPVPPQNFTQEWASQNNRLIERSYQPIDVTLTALSGADWVLNSIPVGTGADQLTQLAITANSFPARSSTGNVAAKPITDFGLSLVDDATAAAARTTLGLVIGTDVQPYDATLTALAAANWSANAIPIGTGADTLSQTTFAANTFPARGSTGDLVAKSITDDALLLLADSDVPRLGTANTWSAANIFQLDSNANYIVDSKNATNGASANAGFRTTSDVAIVSLLSHATARTTSRFGVTIGGYNEIFSFAGNGLIVGTSGAVPVILGTNSAKAVEIDSSQNTTFSGAAKSIHATAGIGYAAGAGGTVTQLTSKSTGVTLNKVCGDITMNNAALAADTNAQFNLTNSAIAATDILHVIHSSAGTVGGYFVQAHSNGAGVASISVRNMTTGSLSEAIVLRFVVLKAVTS